MNLIGPLLASVVIDVRRVPLSVVVHSEDARALVAVAAIGEDEACPRERERES